MAVRVHLPGEAHRLAGRLGRRGRRRWRDGRRSGRRLRRLVLRCGEGVGVREQHHRAGGRGQGGAGKQAGHEGIGQADALQPGRLADSAAHGARDRLHRQRRRAVRPHAQRFARRRRHENPVVRYGDEERRQVRSAQRGKRWLVRNRQARRVLGHDPPLSGRQARRASCGPLCAGSTWHRKINVAAHVLRLRNDHSRCRRRRARIAGGSRLFSKPASLLGATDGAFLR